MDQDGAVVENWRVSPTSDGIKSMKWDSWVCLLCGDSEKDLRLVLTTGDQIKRTTVLILKQGMIYLLLP